MSTDVPDDIFVNPLPGGVAAVLAPHSRDGVPYFQAPLPRRWHRCEPWTSMRLDTGLVERCACGAIRLDGDGWLERNIRRREEAA